MTAPASAAERRFWFAEHVAPGASATIAFGHLRLDGPFAPAALRAAVDVVRMRHPALRTAFVLDSGRLVRRPMPPRHIELVELPPYTTLADATSVLGAERFDLAAGDLLRVAYAADDEGAQIYIAVHHIGFDGMSEGVFAADLASAYGQALVGSPRLGEPRREPAVDLDAGRRHALVDYWSRHLDGAPDLPDPDGVELSQAEVTADELAQLVTEVPADDVREVTRLARDTAVSPFVVLLRAFTTGLSRLTDSTDFCVGTALANRSSAQADEIGCLINTVPIRIRQQDDLWNTVLDAMANSDLPYDEIVAASRCRRGRRMPLYQAMFLLQSWPRPTYPAGLATLRTLPVPPLGPQAEVLLELHDTGAGPLTAFFQAPARSGWAPRLSALADEFHTGLEGATP